MATRQLHLQREDSANKKRSSRGHIRGEKKKKQPRNTVIITLVSFQIDYVRCHSKSLINVHGLYFLWWQPRLEPAPPKLLFGKSLSLWWFGSIIKLQVLVSWPILSLRGNQALLVGKNESNSNCEKSSSSHAHFVRVVIFPTTLDHQFQNILSTG